MIQEAESDYTAHKNKQLYQKVNKMKGGYRWHDKTEY